MGGATADPTGAARCQSPVSSSESCDRGQATAELALLLPVLVMMVLAVVQIGLIARDYVVLQHGVGETARLAALNPDDQAVADAAVSAVPILDHTRLETSVRGGRETGDILTVELRYHLAAQVPLVGVLLEDVVVSAEASVRVE